MSDFLAFLDDPNAEIVEDAVPEPIDSIQEYVILDGREVKATVAQRVAQCGKLRHKGNPRTGERVGYYQECGYFRHCPNCRSKRIQEEVSQLDQALGEEKKLHKLVLPSDSDMPKELDCSEYRRYPQEDGTTVVITTNEEIGGEEVDVKEEDWEKLVITPEGKNISGKLGSRPKAAGGNGDKKEVRAKNVKVRSVVVEDTKDRTEDEKQVDYTEAWESATIKTIDLEPTLDTVYKSLRERQAEYELELERKGYVVTFVVYEFEHIREDQIDWTRYNDYIRKKYQIDVADDEKIDQERIQQQLRMDFPDITDPDCPF